MYHPMFSPISCEVKRTVQCRQTPCALCRVSDHRQDNTTGSQDTDTIQPSYGSDVTIQVLCLSNIRTVESFHIDNCDV